MTCLVNLIILNLSLKDYQYDFLNLIFVINIIVTT